MHDQNRLPSGEAGLRSSVLLSSCLEPAWRKAQPKVSRYFLFGTIAFCTQNVDADSLSCSQPGDGLSNIALPKCSTASQLVGEYYYSLAELVTHLRKILSLLLLVSVSDNLVYAQVTVGPVRQADGSAGSTYLLHGYTMLQITQTHASILFCRSSRRNGVRPAKPWSKVFLTKRPRSSAGSISEWHN
jgi:hypothetical protein